jgi:fermentation-respiration switch protein FrsA (DUF1100 family)
MFAFLLVHKENMNKLLTKILIFSISIIFVWVSICATVRANADKIVFHELKTYVSYNDIPKFTQYFEINSHKEKTDLKFYKSDKPGKLTILFHGNGGLSTWFLKDIITQGDILVPSYPGYLESEGKSTLENFYETGDIAYQKALDLGYREDQITIWGHSLGGAMATYVSSKHPNLNKTILVNTFNNLRDVCEKRIGPFCIFGYGLLPSDEYASKIKGKVRQFHDRGDKVIAFELGEKLYSSIGSSDKKFIVFENGDHNNFSILKTFED